MNIDRGSGSSWPIGVAFIGNTLYFQATDGIHGRELYTNLHIYTEVT